MGLFGKLSENLHHGGVKVQLQAPGSIPGNAIIPVNVTVTADSTQTINAIVVEIKVQEREQGMGVGIGNNNGFNDGYNNQQTMQQTIATVESREPFTINAGESKTVQLQLALNGSAAMGGAGQLAGMGGNLGHALSAIAAVANNFESVSYSYSVHAKADVAGITMDPSDHQPIQILPPQQQAVAPAPQAAAPIPAPQPIQPEAPIPPTNPQQQ